MTGKPEDRPINYQSDQRLGDGIQQQAKRLNQAIAAAADEGMIVDIGVESFETPGIPNYPSITATVSRPVGLAEVANA